MAGRSGPAARGGFPPGLLQAGAGIDHRRQERRGWFEGLRQTVAADTSWRTGPIWFPILWLVTAIIVTMATAIIGTVCYPDLPGHLAKAGRSTRCRASARPCPSCPLRSACSSWPPSPAGEPGRIPSARHHPWPGSRGRRQRGGGDRFRKGDLSMSTATRRRHRRQPLRRRLYV